MEDLMGIGVILGYFGVPIGIGWAIAGWAFSNRSFTELLRSIFRAIINIYIIVLIMIVVGYYFHNK